jgi:hypothetical protein
MYLVSGPVKLQCIAGGGLFEIFCNISEKSQQRLQIAIVLYVIYTIYLIIIKHVPIVSKVLCSNPAYSTSEGLQMEKNSE